MKLSTKIITPDNKLIEPEIIEVASASNPLIRSVKLYHQKVCIGTMQYRIEADHIYIERRDNLFLKTPGYRHVGTALGEYAFRKSVELGKAGHLKNHASESSHLFHYASGFRVPEQLDEPYGLFAGPLGLSLKKLYTEYKKLPNSGNKAKLLEHKLYPSLKKHALKNMQRDINEDLPLETVIQHVKSHSINDRLKTLLEESKKTGKKTNTESFNSFVMYLPDEMIPVKAKEFGIDLTMQADQKTPLSATVGLFAPPPIDPKKLELLESFKKLYLKSLSLALDYITLTANTADPKRKLAEAFLQDIRGRYQAIADQDKPIELDAELLLKDYQSLQMAARGLAKYIGVTDSIFSEDIATKMQRHS